MPIDVLDSIWQDVKDNTNAPEEYKTHCLMKVGDRWRDWKARLKANYYDVYETDEERLRNVPKRVVPEQWPTLVRYWGTKEAQDRSKKNKTNRAGQQNLHRTGRESFAVIRDKLEKEGKKTDRINVFIRTRTKDDVASDPQVAEVIAELREGLSQRPEAEQTPEFCEEVWKKNMGMDGHGRVRTYGLGLSPTDIFSPKESAPSDDTIHKMREDLRDELRVEIRDEIREEFRSELDILRAQMNAMKAYMERQGFGISPDMRSVPSSSGQVPDASSGHHAPLEARTPPQAQQQLFSSELPQH